MLFSDSLLYITFSRVPQAHDPNRILSECNQVQEAIARWLKNDCESIDTKLFIFLPDENPGRELLQRTHSQHEAVGMMFPDEQRLVVVGRPADPRFWTVLRHEITHHALRSCTPPPMIFHFGWTRGLQPCLRQESMKWVLPNAVKNV